MASTGNGKFDGIAKFFKEYELKNLFLRYIQLIIAVEIIILIMVLTGYAASKAQSFPTKLYLFLAFGVPLAITFLLGAVIQAFGKFIYGDKISSKEQEEDGNTIMSAPTRWIGQGLWSAVTDAPYLVKMVLFLASIFFLFKLEDILGFFIRAGGQAFDSLILIGGFLIGGATILGLFWMLAVFRLKNKQMDYHHQYRSDILERLELMVLDDETVVDKSGNIVPIKGMKQVGESTIELEPDYHIQPKKIEDKTRINERE